VQNDLIKLRNLGKTSVMWLQAIGVNTEDELIKRGPVEVYQTIKARGFRTNRVLLYALQGALLDIHWNEIDPKLKAELLAKVECPEDQKIKYKEAN
jgi:DNA transformation protein